MHLNLLLNLHVIFYVDLCGIIYMYCVYFFLVCHLQILRRDDSKLWIAYENIASKADAVKQASGEEDVKPEEPPKEVKEGEPIPLAPPNKWVMKIVEEILNTFNNNFTLDELIFGPGM